MSGSIEDVKAGILAAQDNYDTAVGAIAQAQSSLEAAKGALMRAAEGSSQDDGPACVAALDAVISILEQAQAGVHGAADAATSWAARL